MIVYLTLTEVQCSIGDLPSVLDSILIAGNQTLYNYNTSITYQCIPGFHFIGSASSSQESTCMANTSWSYLPNCEGKCISQYTKLSSSAPICCIQLIFFLRKINLFIVWHCPPVPIWDGYEVDSNNTAYQSVIEVTCISKHNTTRNSSTKVTCEEDGMWEPAIPTTCEGSSVKTL